MFELLHVPSLLIGIMKFLALMKLYLKINLQYKQLGLS